MGIIGVVAAITIPSLMTKINDKINSNRSSVIEKRLLQGLNMLNTQDNGLSVQYNTTEDFVKALSKHLKITHICSNQNLTECFPYEDLYYTTNDGKNESVKVSNLKLAKNLQIRSEGFDDTAGFIMADGTPFIIAYNKECTSADPDRPFKDIPDCVTAIYDLNGASKPNRFGTTIKDDKVVNTADIRSINGARLGCAVKINNVCVTSTAKYPTAITQAECDKYKSAIGLQYCNQVVIDDVQQPDRYAGARLSCYKQGGRLPSDDELTEIAKQLYNDSTITTEWKGNLTWNPTVKASLGIEDSASWFYLWSSSEYDAMVAYNRVFYSTGTFRNGTNRNDDGFRFVCVGD